jgi:hypothetical protein
MCKLTWRRFLGGGGRQRATRQGEPPKFIWQFISKQRPDVET